jgi:hypothetical protein
MLASPVRPAPFGDVRERSWSRCRAAARWLGARYVNFDNAASTPVLRDVHATLESFYEWY